MDLQLMHTRRLLKGIVETPFFSPQHSGIEHKQTFPCGHQHVRQTAAQREDGTATKSDGNDLFKRQT